MLYPIIKYFKKGRGNKIKKFISILLVIASLFTLSSSMLCCRAEENSTQTTIDIKTTEKKESKDENIKKFLDEKRNYFPENKLLEICRFLSNLSDTELEIALSLNFKNPKLLTLTAILGGAFGVDRFALGSPIRGVSKLALTTVTRLFSTAALNASDFYDRKFFELCMSVTLPTAIMSWVTSITTASERAKEYNYQLFISNNLKLV